MSALFVIIAIAFTLRMVVAMLAPFWGSRKEQLSFELLDEEFREVEALVSRKLTLVQALRDIEYDWKTNKISKEDYERFKRSCERQAVGVMRRLDAIHGGDTEWDEIIDRAIAGRLEALGESAASAEQSIPDPDDIADCSNCQSSLKADDLFCSKCGTPVETPDGPEPLSRFSTPSEVAG